MAASKPQLKKRARRDWSKAKAAKFLAVLADTCNVSEACRQTKVPMTVVYRRRKMDAAFREAWIETLSAAYSRLEMVLLERAFNGTEKVMIRHDGSEDRMREYPNHIALRLLQMHRDTVVEADSEQVHEHADEIRERIVQKLQRMKRRDEEESARSASRGDAARDAVAACSADGSSAEGCVQP